MENCADGAQGRNRTTDTCIFSAVLYQLSYLGADAPPRRRAGLQSARGYRGSIPDCPAIEAGERAQGARRPSGSGVLVAALVLFLVFRAGYGIDAAEASGSDRRRRSGLRAERTDARSAAACRRSDRAGDGASGIGEFADRLSCVPGRKACVPWERRASNVEAAVPLTPR